MCTVTVVPRAAGYRLMCNRDERSSRAAAEPPRWVRMARAAVAFPVDPEGGGTWLATNEQGVTVALLNRQPAGRPGARPASQWATRSRGEIPLALIRAADLDDARARLAMVRPSAYGPFLVLVVWRDRLLLGESDEATMRVEERGLTLPVMFTSSSTGDAAAERARRPLFDAMVVASARPLSGQRAFHDHRWPDRPGLSVRMRRTDARTVSRSRVDVHHGSVSLTYEPMADAC